MQSCNSRKMNVHYSLMQSVFKIKIFIEAFYFSKTFTESIIGERDGRRVSEWVSEFLI